MTGVPTSRRILAVLVTAATTCAVGCGSKPVDPPGIWFGGEPVEHWLDKAAGADTAARIRAVNILANVGPIDPRAIPAVVTALDDPEPSVRAEAVAGLSRLGPTAAVAVPALGRLQQDPDPIIRARAAIAIDRIINPGRQQRQ